MLACILLRWRRNVSDVRMGFGKAQELQEGIQGLSQVEESHHSIHFIRHSQ